MQTCVLVTLHKYKITIRARKHIWFSGLKSFVLKKRVECFSKGFRGYLCVRGIFFGNASFIGQIKNLTFIKSSLRNLDPYSKSAKLQVQLQVYVWRFLKLYTGTIIANKIMEKDISRISARRGFFLSCFTNICTVKSQSLGETRVHIRVILRKTLPDNFDSNGSSKFFA